MGNDGSQKGLMHLIIRVKLYVHSFNPYKEYEIKDLEVSEACKNFTWLISNTNGAAHFENTKDAITLLRAYFNQVIESTPQFCTYARVGWLKTPNGNVYLHGGGAIGSCSKTLSGDPELTIKIAPDVSNINAAKVAFDLPYISSDLSQTLPIFLYAHTGILARLFEEAGHKVRFLLFSEGQTNSFKTVKAVLFANLFNRPTSQPHMSFASTKGGIEINANRYSDCVLIVDDLYPANTKAEQNDLYAKLNILARIYGDGVAPQRMNKGYTMSKVNNPTGLCIITGELIEGVASTLSRLLIINSTASCIDKGRLTYHQENSIIISTHYYHFIEWVTKNYESLVNFIHDRYSHYRVMLSTNGGFARFTDTYISLIVTAEVLMKYAIDISLYTNSEVQDLLDMYSCILQKIVNFNIESIADKDPGIMFLRALQSMISNGDIELLPTDDKTGKYSAKFRGFYDEKYYYLSLDNIFKSVIDFANGRNSCFPLSSTRQLTVALDRIGAIETTEESQNGEPTLKRTLHRKLGTKNAIRYLVVKRDVMVKKLNPL